MINPIKILIVEDEIIASESLKIDLVRLGYQVVGQSRDQETTLKQVKKHQPDLILMDIKLRNEDGIEIVKELSKTSIIPVIYLTAYADHNTILKAISTSPYGYIMKPYTSEVLKINIEIALEKYNRILKTQQKISDLKTKLRDQQNTLENITKIDPLTLLPNQLSLVENFNGILEVLYQQLNAKDDSDDERIPQLIPIFYLNFSRFQLIRDEFGLDASNLIFKALVKRIEANLNDDCILARLENDDFCIITLPIITKQIAIDLAKHLLTKINPPLVYKNQEIYIDFSIGISFYPLQGEQISELLQKAREAVADSRKLGDNQYAVYSPALHEYRPNQMSIEAELHRGIEKNQFELYYQPKVNIRAQKIIGAEALLRWNRSDNQFISPDVFIPIAEEVGLIEEIGEWVLNMACQQFGSLNQQKYGDLLIAVNLSARQFNQDLLEHKILKILANNSFNPNLLEIELTETMLVNNMNLATKKLNKLKSSGLKIAIDDFGKGYSSLGYLQHFNFDILKIDREFIKDIDNNDKNSTIVRCLIDMAHQLNLKVVAEGVETPGELNFLKQNNCDSFQGYLFSRPLPFVQFQELLGRYNG